VLLKDNPFTASDTRRKKEIRAGQVSFQILIKSGGQNSGKCCYFSSAVVAGGA
jgi:hypothetical protein